MYKDVELVVGYSLGFGFSVRVWCVSWNVDKFVLCVGWERGFWLVVFCSLFGFYGVWRNIDIVRDRGLGFGVRVFGLLYLGYVEAGLFYGYSFEKVLGFFLGKS